MNGKSHILLLGADTRFTSLIAKVLMKTATPKHRKLEMSVTAQEGVGKISIKGYITNWKNSADEFERNVDELIDQGVRDVTVYINSGGGSVFEANEIVNIIGRFPGRFKADIGALCASAATIIASKAEHVTIAKNGQYMIHRPMMGVDGNEDDLQSALDLLRSLQTDALETYASKTGLTTAKLTKMWQRDFWMSAKRAKELGFVDEIKGEATIEPEDVYDLQASGYKNIPDSVTAVVMQDDTNSNTDKKQDMKIFAILLGLPEDATEAQITAAIKELKAKADEAAAVKQKLEDQEKATAEAEVKAVLDKAVEDKKLTADMRAHYEKVAKDSGINTVKAIIGGLPKIPNITGQLQEAEPTDQTVPAGREKWSYKEWAENDPKGLAEQAEKKTEMFKKLFKEEYGTDYTG